MQTKDDHTSDRAYIRQAESDWAESVLTNDASVLDRILADDFIGVGPEGSHYSKADAIKDYHTQPSEFVSNHLNEVEIRLYRDAAVAQGNESWKKKDGTPGKFVWTGEVANGRSWLPKISCRRSRQHGGPKLVDL